MSGPTRRLLVFELAGQRYGLELAAVQEVVRAVAVTRLPGAPPIVEGAINVRGRVVPVLDLRSRFGLPARELSSDEHMILARAGRRLVAIRADRTTWLVEVEADQVEEAAGVTPHLRHVAGVAKLPDGLILIHDLETFLTQAEAEALGQAVAASDPSESGVHARGTASAADGEVAGVREAP